MHIQPSRWLPGYTYFTRTGFSINEGRFPNIHASWCDVLGIYFYICVGYALKRHFRFYIVLSTSRCYIGWGNRTHYKLWNRQKKT